MSQTERIHGIVRILESSPGPVPLERFLSEFEISRATFKRDLEYLRDRLNAPIEWIRPELGETGGYVIQGRKDSGARSYGIRGLWFNPSEIYALLMMQHLAAAMEPGLLSEQVSTLMTRISLMLGTAEDDPLQVQSRIRILHSASRRSTPKFFETVARATMKRRRLSLRYYSRSRGQETDRVVSPQRLLHYRENWYLLAWCHQANALRIFSLDAMVWADGRGETAKDVAERTLDRASGENFGIFSGSDRLWAKLRFSLRVAPWVSAEVWHAEQRLKVEKDGSVRLDVPYSDPTEIAMEIMRFGADVEVIEPEALRYQVASEHAKAAGIYQGIAPSESPSALVSS